QSHTHHSPTHTTVPHTPQSRTHHSLTYTTVLHTPKSRTCNRQNEGFLGLCVLSASFPQTSQDICCVVFALFNVVWATLFLERWKQREAELAYRWGTLDTPAESLEEPRPQFRGRCHVHQQDAPQQLHRPHRRSPAAVRRGPGPDGGAVSREEDQVGHIPAATHL
ncbi:hypothetical protein DPEC_G00372870, partial [Dallia pectoralis]